MSHVLGSYCWLNLQVLLNLGYWLWFRMSAYFLWFIDRLLRSIALIVWPILLIIYSRRVYNNFLYSFYCLLLFIRWWSRFSDTNFNFLWLNTLLYNVLHFLRLSLISIDFSFFLYFDYLSFSLSSDIWCLTKLRRFLLVYSW